MPTLVCPVRNCGAPLGETERGATCPRGHGFDRARSGYLNLLGPQDRRSKAPGDSAAAVAARRRLFDRGTGAALTAALVAAFPLAPGDALLDAGCGEGHHLGAFRAAYGAEAWGVDISVPALDLAARRYRDCRFVVANADRRLPFAPGSFRAVASITARMNPAEFHRLLEPGGRLLVAVAGDDDLAELREAVQGAAHGRDRGARTAGKFAPWFALRHRETVREHAFLDHPALADLLASTYRGFRPRERERLARLGAMEVTMSRELLHFAARDPRQAGPLERTPAGAPEPRD